MHSAPFLGVVSPRGKNAGRGQALVNVFVKLMVRMPANIRRDKLALYAKNGLPGFALLALLKYRALVEERRALKHPEGFKHGMSSWADVGYERLKDEKTGEGMGEGRRLSITDGTSSSNSGSEDEDLMDDKPNSKPCIRFAGESTQASRVREARRVKFVARRDAKMSRIPLILRMTPLLPPAESPSPPSPLSSDEEIAIQGALDPMLEVNEKMQEMIAVAKDISVQYRAFETRLAEKRAIGFADEESLGESDKTFTPTDEKEAGLDDLPSAANPATLFNFEATEEPSKTDQAHGQGTVEISSLRDRVRSDVKLITADAPLCSPLQPLTRQPIASQPQRASARSSLSDAIREDKAKKDSLASSSISGPSQKRNENNSPKHTSPPRFGSLGAQFSLTVPSRLAPYRIADTLNLNTLREDELFPDLYRSPRASSVAHEQSSHVSGPAGRAEDRMFPNLFRAPASAQSSQRSSNRTTGPDERASAPETEPEHTQNTSRPPEAADPPAVSMTEAHDFDPFIPSATPANSPTDFRTRAARTNSDNTSTTSETSSSSSRARRALVYKLNGKTKLWSPTASKSTASVGMGSPALGNFSFWGRGMGSAEEVTRRLSQVGGSEERKGVKEMVDVGKGGVSIESRGGSSEEGKVLNGAAERESQKPEARGNGRSGNEAPEMSSTASPLLPQASHNVTSSPPPATPRPSDPEPTTQHMPSEATIATERAKPAHANSAPRRRARRNAVTLPSESATAVLMSTSTMEASLNAVSSTTSRAETPETHPQATNSSEADHGEDPIGQPPPSPRPGFLNLHDDSDIDSDDLPPPPALRATPPTRPRTPPPNPPTRPIVPPSPSSKASTAAAAEAAFHRPLPRFDSDGVTVLDYSQPGMPLNGPLKFMLKLGPPAYARWEDDVDFWVDDEKAPKPRLENDGKWVFPYAYRQRQRGEQQQWDAAQQQQERRDGEQRGVSRQETEVTGREQQQAGERGREQQRNEDRDAIQPVGSSAVARDVIQPVNTNATTRDTVREFARPVAESSRLAATDNRNHDSGRLTLARRRGISLRTTQVTTAEREEAAWMTDDPYIRNYARNSEDELYGMADVAHTPMLKGFPLPTRDTHELNTAMHDMATNPSSYLPSRPGGPVESGLWSMDDITKTSDLSGIGSLEEYKDAQSVKAVRKMQELVEREELVRNIGSLKAQGDVGAEVMARGGLLGGQGKMAMGPAGSVVWFSEVGQKEGGRLQRAYEAVKREDEKVKQAAFELELAHKRLFEPQHRQEQPTDYFSIGQVDHSQHPALRRSSVTAHVANRRASTDSIKTAYAADEPLPNSAYRDRYHLPAASPPSFPDYTAATSAAAPPTTPDRTRRSNCNPQ